MSKRKMDMSVRDPNLPPRLFDGDVADKQGTPAMNIGKAAVRASKEDTAASLRAASIECRAR